MRVRENTLYNLAGAVVPLVVTFVTLPFYLRAVGEERYGVLAILWMLLSYFGLFDAGLGRAAAQQISQLGAASSESRARVFWTALTLNLTLGCAGGLILWLSGGWLLERFALASSELQGEAVQCLGWVGLAVPITTAAAVLGGTLQGLERFVAINGVRIVDQALSQLLPLAVAHFWGPDLAGLVASVVFVRLLSLAIAFAGCVRYLPLRTAPQFDRGRVRQLLSYGGWVGVTSIVSPLLATLDRFIIGAVAGAKAVAYYTVPYSLAYRIAVLPSALSSAIFPRLSAQADAARDSLTHEALRAVLVVVTPIVLVSVLMMKPFLSWWVGVDFAEHAAAPGQIISLGLWFNSLALIPFTRLQAQGQPDVVAKFHLIEIGPYLALLWFSVNAWGIVGAALAWSVRVAADAGLLFSAVPPRRDLWARMLLPALLLTAAGAVALVPPRNILAYWGISMLLFSGSLLWAWKAAPSVVRQLFARFGKAPAAGLRTGERSR